MMTLDLKKEIPTWGMGRCNIKRKKPDSTQKYTKKKQVTWLHFAAAE